MSPKKNDKVYIVFNGPDRDTIYEAMKYAFDDFSHVDAKFEFGASYTTNFAPQDYAKSVVDAKEFRINSIEHRENNGYRFTITGLLEAKLLPIERGYTLYSFVIIYDAKTHTGSIRLIR